MPFFVGIGFVTSLSFWKKHFWEVYILLLIHINKPYHEKLLLFCGLACLLASCSKYQINTVSSTTTKKDLNSGDFIFENDTLAIVYRFNGQNAPLRIQIKNKLNDPLYIDWKRSSLIVKDQAINYMGNKIKIDGSFESSKDLLFSNLNYSTGTLDASATLPEESSFIPPHAMIDKVLLNVTDNFLSVSDNVFQKRLAYLKKEMNLFMLNLQHSRKIIRHWFLEVT